MIDNVALTLSPMAVRDRVVRRHKRVTFTMRAPVATEPASSGLTEDSSIIDMSESGVCVRLRGQIVTGQIVDVFLNERPEQCRAVWTSLDHVTHEVIAGLEFIRPLSDR
jgi:hypothetical protein